MRQHSGAPEPKWNRQITRRIFPPDSEKLSGNETMQPHSKLSTGAQQPSAARCCTSRICGEFCERYPPILILPIPIHLSVTAIFLFSTSFYLKHIFLRGHRPHIRVSVISVRFTRYKRCSHQSSGMAKCFPSTSCVISMVTGINLHEA